MGVRKRKRRWCERKRERGRKRAREREGESLKQVLQELFPDAKYEIITVITGFVQRSDRQQLT